MQLSERLRVALAARPYQTADGQSIPVYLSLGVATMPEDASSVGQLIEVADSNLYASKQRGGNATTGSTTQKEEVVEDRGVLGIAGRLLDAVGARDHYIRRHSEHVVRNALALGYALGLSKDSLQTLHAAAMLHDVGNLGVSQELLRRPGLLGPAEEEQVRGHVRLGAQLILDIPRLSEVAEAVSAHHERYDGTGYPAHTAGGEIPLLGRILAVADAYSAMTLDRPYRKSMSRAQAREELLRGSGSQLDPQLVQTFIHLLDARDDNPTAEHAAAG
jgi:HD-GYP domain-containing protein (c-di-GMP phosphodiesterase class II)